MLAHYLCAGSMCGRIFAYHTIRRSYLMTTLCFKIMAYVIILRFSSMPLNFYEKLVRYISSIYLPICTFPWISTPF
jgi:hypothetical protein